MMISGSALKRSRSFCQKFPGDSSRQPCSGSRFLSFLRPGSRSVTCRHTSSRLLTPELKGKHRPVRPNRGKAFGGEHPRDLHQVSLLFLSQLRKELCLPGTVNRLQNSISIPGCCLSPQLRLLTHLCYHTSTFKTLPPDREPLSGILPGLKALCTPLSPHALDVSQESWSALLRWIL